MILKLNHINFFQFLFFTFFSATYAVHALPDFYEYPVTTKDSVEKSPAPIDLSSYPGAKKYRTRLREGARKGPNFAGHYTIITYGCGTECQENWIVEAKSGKILDRFFSAFGLKYQLDSALMVVNPPTSEFIQDYKEDDIPFYKGIETTYKVLKNDKFVILYQDTLLNIVKKSQ